jgi:hypothetical protein
MGEDGFCNNYCLPGRSSSLNPHNSSRSLILPFYHWRSRNLKQVSARQTQCHVPEPWFGPFPSSLWIIRSPDSRGLALLHFHHCGYVWLCPVSQVHHHECFSFSPIQQGPKCNEIRTEICPLVGISMVRWSVVTDKVPLEATELAEG